MEVDASTAVHAPAVIVRRLSNLSGRDAEVAVLKGIDLEVRMGELLLLVGESGGGKTALLSAIAGILEIDEGDLDVLGVPLPRLSGGKKTKFGGRRWGSSFSSSTCCPHSRLPRTWRCPC